MSTILESHPEPKTEETPLWMAEIHLEDGEWLKTLTLRRSVSSELADSAAAGDVPSFVDELLQLSKAQQPLRARELKSRLKDLQLLCESTGVHPELDAALFDLALRKSERSVRVEAFLAEQGDEPPTVVTLSTALWIVVVHRNRLKKSALFALWRWCVQAGRTWMDERPVCDPEQGLSQLRHLELCLMLSAALNELRGSRKLLKESIGLIRACVDESTDTDGTPQPQWFPTLFDSLSILSRMTLFGDMTATKVWNATTHDRLQQLLGRTLSWCSPHHDSFSLTPAEQNHSRLLTVIHLLGGDAQSAFTKLVQHWRQADSSRRLRKRSTHELPEVSHQSDWAMLACLRSDWAGPANYCAITFDDHVPQISIVANDTLLCEGGWSQDLMINGRSRACAAHWTCTCWFSDSEVSFVELMQEVDETTRVIRQLILLRETEQLVINSAVHAEGATEIQYSSTLPISVRCRCEEDSATRELALFVSDQRVRVFPLSIPQSKVEQARGAVTVRENQFVVEQRSTGGHLFTSTVLDWSPQRMHKPVEWSRLTVAQNGNIEPHHQAAGFRLRVKRDQWLLYHSLVAPDIPRTVMGLHTLNETVYARFTAKGEFEPLIEVET